MLSDEPDLMRELDAAEDIVMGRAEAVVTEFGVRRPDGCVHWFGSDEDAVPGAEQWISSHEGCVLVRRTVTYGPWEEVPGEHNPG